MKRNQIWQAIEMELRASKRVHPNWPDHVAAQAGIVTDEAGKLMHSSLEWKYNRSKDFEKEQIENIKEVAITTAVATIRFLENLKDDTTEKNINPIR